ncbi:MAG: S8 family serine peptidase, partial [Planctomycetota bacterium]|nr:S8 family serine peptidase [Planctomycetota bacterium]
MLSEHSTHVAGTIGASGVDANAHGMASGVQIVSYDWEDDITEIGESSNLVASNHSYGTSCGWGVALFPFGRADVWYGNRTLFTEDPLFGKYTAGTAELDQVLYDTPDLVSVWAAGNDRDDQFQNLFQNERGFWASIYVTYLEANSGTIVGPYTYQGPGFYPVFNQGVTTAPGADGSPSGYDSLSPEATAKNSVVVGAVDDITADPYTNGDVEMTDFSGWGPTDDGRVKVDLVANGVNLYSSGSSADNAYLSMSGTSMAAPNVTGTAVLLIQHYENLFGSAPLASTTKGLLIHTAFDAGNPGPDYTYGWGVVDAAAAANYLTDAHGTIHSGWFEEDTYTGSERTYTLVSDGTQAIKATAVWTDPPGTAQAAGVDVTTSVLVNNLDLWITGPSGTTRPWLLDPSNPGNNASAGINNRDNVEQVLVESPVAGTYTIHIGGSLGAGYNQQTFSLLVSGEDDTPPTAAFGTVSTPTQAALASLAVNFSETINAAEFTLADLVLAREGNSVSWEGTCASLADTGDHQHFTLSGLSALTDKAGRYELTLTAAGSGITDGAGNALAANASAPWTMNAIISDTGNDTVRLSWDAGNSRTKIEVNQNAAYWLNPAGFPILNVNTDGGDDTLTVDFSAGNPTPAAGIVFDGGAGELLRILGTTGNDAVTLTSTGATVNGAAITYTSAIDRAVAVELGDEDDTITVDSGSFLFTTDVTAGTFNVGGGSAAVSGTLSVTGTVAVNGGAALTAGDVTANAFNVNDGSAAIASLTGTGTTPSALVAEGQTMSVGGGMKGMSSLTVNGTLLTSQTTRSTIDTASLTIGANGQLDLKDGFLAINYEDASPIDDIMAWITSGFNGFGWDGKGIISSTALEIDPFSYAVGYAENYAIFVETPWGPGNPFGDSE